MARISDLASVMHRTGEGHSMLRGKPSPATLDKEEPVSQHDAVVTVATDASTHVWDLDDREAYIFAAAQFALWCEAREGELVTLVLRDGVPVAVCEREQETLPRKKQRDLEMLGLREPPEQDR